MTNNKHTVVQFLLTLATLVSITVAAVVLRVAIGGDPAATAQPGAGWCADQGKLAILGDSTATGYGASGYPSTAPGYVSTTYGWPSRLATQLGAEHGTQMLNLARNGALTTDFLPEGIGEHPRPAGNFVPTAISQLQTYQPNMVVIALGANEYGSNRSTSTYHTNLEDLVTRVEAAVPNASLLLVHTWWFGFRWPGNGEPWTAYKTVMKQVVNEHSTEYMDMTAFMTAAHLDGAGLYVPNEYGPGQFYSVHTNNAGHGVQYAGYYQELEC